LSDSTVAPSIPPEAPKAFVRKSSGLVRAFSPTDTFLYNLLAMNPVLMTGLTFTLIVVTFPNANPWLAVLFAGVLCIPEAYVYSLLVSAMPRSGGDYIFQSRILGGATASFFNFAGILCSQVFSIIVVGITAAALVLAPGFTLLGAYYNADWLLNAGEWFGTSTGIFWTAVGCSVWATIVNLIGLRRYATFQRYSMIVGLSGFVVVVIIMLLQSKSGFISNFNGFMSSHYGVHDAYDRIVEKGGVHSSHFTLNGTLVAIPLAAFSFIFPAWGALQAGEIKRAGTVKWNAYAIMGAQAVAIAIATIAGALLLAKVGYGFFASSGTLSLGGEGGNLTPIPPYFGFFAAITGNSPAMALLLLVVGLAWLLMWFPNLTLGFTRVALAMSFDGVLPAWVGKVSHRTHVPSNAIISCFVAFLAMCILYLLDESVVAFTVGVTLLAVTTFAVTMVAAAVFPFRRRRLFESSPKAVQVKIGGVPVISIAATLFFIVAAWIDYRSLTDDRLGINTTKGLVVLAVFYGAGALLYGGAVWSRRKRGGISLSDTYRELPAE